MPPMAAAYSDQHREKSPRFRWSSVAPGALILIPISPLTPVMFPVR